jgi:hypothetical protein
MVQRLLSRRPSNRGAHAAVGLAVVLALSLHMTLLAVQDQKTGQSKVGLLPRIRSTANR